ncbi:hypothetical protein RN001_005657 [Aquatica leii]|uniref:Uncharacterized protein n=1 Tax=Aquatica leii TaxID=1421715 RepID=A0AAN7PD04_9COLE|nr:hypothetical protein RN001_005657 [Aquatica leii]
MPLQVYGFCSAFNIFCYIEISLEQRGQSGDDYNYNCSPVSSLSESGISLEPRGQSEEDDHTQREIFVYFIYNC